LGLDKFHECRRFLVHPYYKLGLDGVLQVIAHNGWVGHACGRTGWVRRAAQPVRPLHKSGSSKAAAGNAAREYNVISPSIASSSFRERLAEKRFEHKASEDSGPRATTGRGYKHDRFASAGPLDPLEEEFRPVISRHHRLR
jgi:hypothetical protein